MTGSRPVTLVVVLGSLALAAYVAFQQIFSTYAIYDDEGYVMLSLQGYLRGHALYDEIYTQYGPGYYVFESFLHGVTNWPITHDLIRLKTCGVWLLVACLGGGYVWALTGARLTAWVAACAVFLHLDKLCLEPGHPQMWIALGMIVACWIGYWIDQTRGWLRSVGYGVLGLTVGGLLLIKLNVGLFLLISLFCAGLEKWPQGWARTGGRTLGWLAASILPLALYRQHLWEWSSLALPVVTLLGAWLLYRCDERPSACLPTTGHPFRASMVGCVGLAAMVAILVGVTFSRGTSWSGLVYGLVGQHARFGDRFYHAPDLPPASIVLALLAVIGCCRVYRASAAKGSEAGQGTDGRTELAVWMPNLAWLVTLGVLLLTGVAYATDTLQDLVHGLQPRHHTRLWMACSPCILAAAVLTSQRAGTSVVPRWLLWMALLQPLAVFPTPGTQAAIGTYPLLLVALLTIHAVWAGRAVPRAEVPSDTRPLPLGAFAYGRLVVGVCVSLIVFRAVTFTLHRNRLLPFDFPGCQLLRAEARHVLPMRELVAELRMRADTFVFAQHGHNSLYFWAEREPPTYLNPTFWPYLLSPPEQARVVHALAECPRLCVVQEELGIELPHGPMSQYFQRHFAPAWGNPTYQIAMRRAAGTIEPNQQDRRDGPATMQD